jgi:hypothetical protein
LQGKVSVMYPYNHHYCKASPAGQRQNDGNRADEA